MKKLYSPIDLKITAGFSSSALAIAFVFSNRCLSDYAVYRPSNGVWYLLQSTKGFGAVQFGISNDKPVVGDYDGDGKADQSVYRVESGA